MGVVGPLLHGSLRRAPSALKLHGGMPSCRSARGHWLPGMAGFSVSTLIHAKAGKRNHNKSV